MEMANYWDRMGQGDRKGREVTARNTSEWEGARAVLVHEQLLAVIHDDVVHSAVLSYLHHFAVNEGNRVEVAIFPSTLGPGEVNLTATGHPTGMKTGERKHQSSNFIYSLDILHHPITVRQLS